MSKIVRLVSYNIHRGLSPFRLIEVQENIAQVLKASSADILCLQEDISHEVLEISHLADRCSATWSHAVYGETVLAEKGSQGNSIFTSFPILATRNLDISASSGEPRRLLGVKLQITKGLSFWVYCTHLGLRAHQRQENIELLNSHLRAHHEFCPTSIEPLIVAGDFNDWRCQISGFLRESLFLQEAFEYLSGAPARTFPAFWPVLPLDRIYFKGLRPIAAHMVAIGSWKGHSDHLPIAFDFTLN